MPQSAQPNLVLIFSDQQHWQAAGYEDKTFPTPNLDRLAGQSVIFDHAFCTTPQCSPARSSLLTGLYPTQTGMMGNVGAAGGSHLAMPTIAPRLKKLGYRTGYFGKWHLGKDPVGTAGWDREFGIQTGPANDDAKISDAALEFLAGVERQPFALVVSYQEPHGVYQFNRHNPGPGPQPVELPHSWRRETFSGKPAVQQQFMTEDQGHNIASKDEIWWQSYRAFYRRRVEMFDTEVGRILGALAAKNQDQNALLVVTSDHGDMDTHHRLIFKGPFMYEHMVRVPLLVRPPSVAGGSDQHGRRVHDLVNHPDVAALLLDYAGDPSPVGCGKSLRPFLNHASPPAWRKEVVSQYYGKQHWVNPIRMIRNHELKYTLYRTMEEELYDLVNDPHEVVNLAADPAWSGAKQDMRQKLDQWMIQNQDPFYSLSPSGKPAGAEDKTG